MLKTLHLRDFVIVEVAEMEFSSGLSALTGETGAGKSVVVDALSILAGGRAGADLVRHGADHAEATAAFGNLPPAALAWLEEQAIEHDGEVLLRRVIGMDGRSRAFLNGRPVALQTLRDFADLVIEIHGQQEFQHLVRRDAQRALLDRHAGAETSAQAVASIYAQYRQCRLEAEALQAAADNRDARLDLLRYQLGELADEVSSVPEIEELLLERKRIAGRGRLAEAARMALGAVYEADGDSAQDLLAKAQSALRAPTEPDPTLSEAGKLLADASIQIQEAALVLRRFLDSLDVDPARIEDIERRAATLEALARKHRVAITELPELRRKLEQEREQLTHLHESSAQLAERVGALQRDYRAAAARLSAVRRTAAEDLGAKITSLMQSLGMAGGSFSVGLTTSEAEPSAHGDDQIEFLVAANPGQPAKSLAKVASGGELSRISLAVQVAAAANTTAACMVFDEVDAGIGGAIAEIVGRQLRELGARGQVLCVTHLPQVASQADSQFRVVKRSPGGSTRTSIERLGESDRIDEIARMLGGVDITSQARSHAREMLELASATGRATLAVPPQASAESATPEQKPRRTRAGKS